MTERQHSTRSRSNPGGIADVLSVLGPETVPHGSRKPRWFKVPAPGGPRYRELNSLIESENLHTVCREAACPNIGECWQRGTATFMILGDTCTRRCGFCNVKTGKPTWDDPLEPARVARSVARMGLRHAVITSVDRDDLPDYGASAFVGVIRQIRRQSPKTKIEVLTPDFRGVEMPLAKVIAERPDVFNHNVEVVPRLYPVARRGSTWERSKRVLRNAKAYGGDEVTTKSGLMVGLGETFEEMVQALGELARERGPGPDRRPVPAPHGAPSADRALLASGRVQGARGGRVRARVRACRRGAARALQLSRRPAHRAERAWRRPSEGDGMTRTRRAALIAVSAVAVALVVAPAALATAGGGSSGFSGGGGGGGHGSGFALYIVLDLLFHIALLGHGLGALVLIALALAYYFITRVLPKMQAAAAERAAQHAGGKRKTSKRERSVELAAAEAADEDPEFDPDNVRAIASKLFMEIERAWDQDDRMHLRGLVAADLLTEWERRLEDFERRGWRNHVEPIGEPAVELVGLHRTGDPDNDRVVVKIDARVKDYVVDSYGRHLKRTGKLGELTRIREFWTLKRRGPHWVLASIEQGAEGKHALEEQIVATPWADEGAMRDDALIEGAVADQVPEGTSVAEVADLQYDGDAHAAAMDLSLADGRFAPDVLEIAARRAVDAWAQAIDGADDLLDGIATPQAKRELLYAGDTSGTVRMVVRGPVVNRIRVVHLDAAADPPTMTIEVDLTGRRYIENRDTAAVLAGSRTRKASFTERWTLSVTGDPQQPWRITSVTAPVGLA